MKTDRTGVGCANHPLYNDVVRDCTASEVHHIVDGCVLGRVTLIQIAFRQIKKCFGCLYPNSAKVTGQKTPDKNSEVTGITNIADASLWGYNLG